MRASPRSRRLLLILAAAGLLAGAILLFAWPSLENEIRRRVETAGSALTGASLHLDAVELALPAGSGKLLGLRLGNPPGFGPGPALETDAVDFHVEPTTIESSTVVVDRVSVAAPRVSVVVDAQGRTNFRAIDERVRAAERTEDGGGLPRLAIARLEIATGTVRIAAPSLLRESIDVPLKGVVLTDLGTAEHGWTVHRIGRQVHDALVRQVASAMTDTALARLDEGLGGATRRLQDAFQSPSVRRPIEEWANALRGGADAVERTLRRAAEPAE